MRRTVLGVDIVGATPMGGSVELVELADGRAVVTKTGDTVESEAAGLRWLAVPGGPGVPEVLDARDDELVTRFIAAGDATRAAAERFGRELTVVHAAGAEAFGAPPPGGPADAWIGEAPMRNDPAPAWPSWYAADRLQPYLRTARDRGAISPADTAAVDQVCARIEDLAGPAEPPARLHGDLWGMNVIWAQERGFVVDPAAHGGHRETDLAMLALFNLAHLDVVLAAYDEAAPLADGWRDRVALHQLFPLLVHAALFGFDYGAQAGAAARTALRAG